MGLQSRLSHHQLWVREGDKPKIGANHFSARVQVGHVDGPDAGAGADVEDAVRVRDGRQVQLPVGEVEHDFVVQIEPFFPPPPLSANGKYWVHE